MLEGDSDWMEERGQSDEWKDWKWKGRCDEQEQRVGMDKTAHSWATRKGKQWLSLMQH